MKSTSEPRSGHLLRLKLTLAVTLSLLILGWLSWNAYNDYLYAEAQLPAIARMEIVRAEIIHLDEVLTMSARMAAASGNLDWEARYRRLEPQLDQSIKEALQLVPSASHGASAAKIDAANDALVAMEHHAFELVRQGKNAEAQRLLSSAEYEVFKETYAAGMAEFNSHLLQARNAMSAGLHAEMLRTAITTVASTVLLMLGALLVFRAMRRWQAVIVESNRELNRKTAELEELNNQLDTKVSERTKELNESVRQHQLAAERAEESEARFRSLTEMSSDFYWESDAEHRLTHRSSANRKVGTASMFRRGVQIGERRWEIPYLSPDEAGWQAHRTELDAHRPFRAFEHSRFGADGTERHISISGDPVFDAIGAFKGYRGVGTDITEHKRAEERIQRAAHHDSLTGLPNRLLFNDRLDQAIRLAKRNGLQFALLYLDLDKFKPVNDTLGHTAGDELLKGVATRIRHQVRESDTVARVGGDEFIVILLDIAGRGQAETVARKIVAALATPFQFGSPKQSVDIGTSIGIAIYPADALEADALVKAADAAMYSAKQAGSSILLRAA